MTQTIVNVESETLLATTGALSGGACSLGDPIGLRSQPLLLGFLLLCESSLHLLCLSERRLKPIFLVLEIVLFVHQTFSLCKLFIVEVNTPIVEGSLC